jgi:hypothetical protein
MSLSKSMQSKIFADVLPTTNTRRQEAGLADLLGNSRLKQRRN